MFDEALKSKLKARFENIIFDEPLSKHVTMHVGGPADGFLGVTEEEIPAVCDFCRDNGVDYYVIGNGSNTVVRDGGYRGLIICIGRRMNKVEFTPDGQIIAQAGAKLSMVAECAAKNGIAGFEFLAGIPGNVGGALVMNAGAYGGEIQSLLESVTFFENGQIRTARPEELGYGYRKSYFLSNPDAIITRAVFRGNPADKVEIRELMSQLAQKRCASQPLEYPSSGSFFKRPEGYFAGKLVQDCGLKGYKCGGAAISEKHAGFVINCGDATCHDIQMLSKHVKDTVREQFGVELEPEVRFIGSDE